MLHFGTERDFHGDNVSHVLYNQLYRECVEQERHSENAVETSVETKKMAFVNTLLEVNIFIAFIYRSKQLTYMAIVG